MSKIIQSIPGTRYFGKRIFPEEIDAFYDLVCSIASELQACPHSKDVLNDYLSKDNHWVFGVFDQEKLIGSAALEYVRHTERLSYLEFTGAQRLMSYQGRKVGDALFKMRFDALEDPIIMDEIKRASILLGGKSANLTQAVAHVRPDNNAARKALERHGFKLSEIEVELSGEIHQVCFVDIQRNPRLTLELP